MTENTPTLEAISQHPEPVKDRLLQLRRLILEVAEHNDAIGEVEETLKWGQPSFLTVKPKTGTTVRIDRDTSGEGDVVLFVHCQTSLVSHWRALFPDVSFGGNRSVHFKSEDPLPEDEIRQMITMAFTYHRSR
ncbi:DUF1801 domain-containing protein [uncultured Roseibium sp.]|uniref:DUF1801 domain-containing protein n=1 Tax=uncultured Roseibium sp. TaxID=1936171 RepID=UPI0026130FF0|nr:DUF1801 domain-containing protein [uncultured Roseibium sp.]